MEQKTKSNKEQKSSPHTNDYDKAFHLISSIKKGHDITVRDDQYEFPSLLDAVKICRRRGHRFRLVDSGKLDRFQLEWLLTAGADFFTSDEARKDYQEIESLQKSCQTGNAFLAFFQHDSLESGAESEPSLFSDLLNLGRSGIYLHITNREQERDPAFLIKLAEACRSGGSWLVYYHHGSIEPALEDLYRSGAWIHLSDKSIKDEEDQMLLMDIMKARPFSRVNLALFLEKGLDYLFLKEIIRAGAYVFFQKSQIDYRSPYKALEKAAAKRKLDVRAYYLYPVFLQ